jgi:hypothetical protein
VRDARGQDVPLIGSPGWSDWRQFPFWGRGKAIEAAGEPWVTEYRMATTMGSLWGLLAGALLVFIRPLVNHIVAQGSAGWKAWAAAIIAGVMLWPMFSIFEALMRRARRDQLMVAYLAAGRCPSCNYTLRALVPNPHPAAVDVVTCPECGAAWELRGGG